MESYEFPELTNTESILLVKFVDFADNHGLTRVDVANIHTNTQEFGVRPIMLRAMFDRLCQKSLLFVSRDRDRVTFEDTLYFEINPAFADQIDSYVNFIKTQQVPATELGDVPRADRFPAIGKRSAFVDAAMDAIEKLCDTLNTADELIANPEYREQICAEFDYFKEVINKPRIHLAALDDFTNHNTTLKWLANQQASRAIQQDASALLAKLNALTEILAPQL